MSYPDALQRAGGEVERAWRIRLLGADSDSVGLPRRSLPNGKGTALWRRFSIRNGKRFPWYAGRYHQGPASATCTKQRWIKRYQTLSGFGTVASVTARRGVLAAATAPASDVVGLSGAGCHSRKQSVAGLKHHGITARGQVRRGGQVALNSTAFTIRTIGRSSS